MGTDLHSLYIFEGLSKPEIDYFLLTSETLKFPKGTKIIREGDPDDKKAYYLISGSVEVFRDNEKFASLKKGDIFGELSLIINEPRNATVIASEDIEVQVFNKEDFIMLYEKSDKHKELMKKIFERIRSNFYGIKK